MLRVNGRLGFKPGLFGEAHCNHAALVLLKAAQKGESS